MTVAGPGQPQRPTRSLRESLAWAFAMNWGERGLITLFTLVLAALLGPHDFGLMAMALVYVALIQLVLEQGISTAIIQRPALEREHLDSAFWLTLVWCLLLAGVSVALSEWWAGVNDAPELASVIQVLSIVLLAQGLRIVQYAMLQRETRFKELALCLNVGALVGGLAGLALALAGAGVWALVAQQLAMEGVVLALMWVVGGWWPRLRVSWRHTRDLLAFSADVFVANVGGFVSRRADILLMGLFLSPAAVGLYRLADRIVDALLDVTMRPIGLISLPHFSRLQHDPEGLRRSVLACVRGTFLIALPSMLVLAASSDDVVGVLGDKWQPAGDVLAILTLVGIAKGLTFYTGPLLFAVAKPRFRAVMIWTLAVLSAGTVAVTGGLVEDSALSQQIVGMSASRAALFLLIFVPVNFAIVAHVTGLSLRSMLAAAPTPLLAGLLAAGLITLLHLSGLLDPLPDAAALLASGTLGAACAGAVLLLDSDARAAALAIRRRLATPGPRRSATAAQR
jgi:PST family polysaccharide transporter